MPHGFDAPKLTDPLLAELTERRRRVAADIVRLTSLAGCGHPGGSLSTLDALILLYGCARVNASAPHARDRDRIVISHGHITPGVYGTLAEFGFVDHEDVYVGFRRAGSVFGGHVENFVPGVEWNTGNLGQGLSAGAGFAMAAKLRGQDYRVFVGMGDGEQQKGQLSEARRFAAKFGLSNLIGFVDVNDLQIGGDRHEIMPQDLEAEWRSGGWNVLVVEDGNDLGALYDAFRAAVTRETDNPEAPTVLLLQTIMGSGIPEIEDDYNYHGKALTDEMAERALDHLGAESNLAALRDLRASRRDDVEHDVVRDRDVQLDVGTPRTYGTDVRTDCRSAYGAALNDLAKRNNGRDDRWPVVGISCDLEGSVKMNAFHETSPDHFLEVGVQEHHAAVLAGSLSTCGIVPFFSTFGMFGIVECYNQQRLNDQNCTGHNTVVTHCGLDVGEDGPTHQCIDYVALIRNLFGAELYVPADPNEADRIIRAVSTRYAPTFVAMGRSKLPVIGTPDGAPALGGDHTFEPGIWPMLREGNDAAILAFGPMVYRAVDVSDQLRSEGIAARVYNCSSLAPHDADAILTAARETGVLVTYEDHVAQNGLGHLVAATLGEAGVSAKLQRLGVTRYGTSGRVPELFAEQGLAPEHLAEAVRGLVR